MFRPSAPKPASVRLIVSLALPSVMAPLFRWPVAGLVPPRVSWLVSIRASSAVVSASVLAGLAELVSTIGVAAA